MRVSSLGIAVAVTMLWGVAPRSVAARTDCQTNKTAVCFELGGQVGEYAPWVWAVCDARGEAVCGCYDQQKVQSGVEWCPWANCMCKTLPEGNLRNGACGLASACTSLSVLQANATQEEKASAQGQLASAVARVRKGDQGVQCSPEACTTVGPVCTRAMGALSILKDDGRIKDEKQCQAAAKDSASFAKTLMIEEIPTAVAHCACSAVF